MMNRQHIVVSFALVALCLVIYGQTLTHEFVRFDDPIYVTDNPEVKAGLTYDSVVWAFLNSRANYFQPLAWLSHELDCQIYGLRAWGHHLTNLLFHTANSVLLFLVLFRLTRGQGKNSVWPSALAAAWFAVHPLHVESVAWVAERKDVLSAFFWLLALDAYARYAAAPGARRYGAVVLWFALGLMSKPMVVTLPCVLLLLDYWPLGRFEGANGRREFVRRGVRLAVEKAPLFALTIAASVATYVMQKRGGNLTFGETVPLLVRITNVPVAYAFYLAKTFWPSGLAMFYPLPLAMRPWWLIAGSALVLLAVSVIVLAERKRRPYLVVGWLWFVGTLVPVIEVVQAGKFAYADRYTYIPSIGLFLMGAWSLPRSLTAAVRYGTLLTVAILTVAAVFQTHYWRSDEALFEHAIEVTTNNAVAHNNLGAAQYSEKRYKEAEAEYREALRIDPSFSTAYTNLAKLAAETGRLDEAVAFCEKAVEINPASKNGQYFLGIFLAQQGKNEEALEHSRLAVSADPDNPHAQYNLGSVLSALGRNDEAADCYRAALRLNPGLAEAHNNLSDLLLRQGQAAEAEKHCLEAVAINPGYAEAYNNLGSALAYQGRYEEAAARYNKALEINPNYVNAHFNLGRVLSEMGRTEEAAAKFKKTLELDPQHPYARQLLDELEQKGRREQPPSP